MNNFVSGVIGPVNIWVLLHGTIFAFVIVILHGYTRVKAIF